MPSFSVEISHEKNGGLRLTVPIVIADASHVPNTYVRVSNLPSKIEIDLHGDVVEGLVNTGATATCVSKSFADG